MRFLRNQPVSAINIDVLELTRKNLETLLAKLDRPGSSRMLINGDYDIAVRAVEDEEHYADRPAGATLEDVEAQLAEVARIKRQLDQLFAELREPPPEES